MKTVQRNQVPVWYALCLGEEEILDDAGNRTGEYDVKYSTPVMAWMVLSANRGSAAREAFGISTNYSRTMTTGDMDCPIAEDSVLWIGTDPTIEVEGVTVKVPHNFVVVRVSPSLNYISYAIREVDVSEVE